MPQELTSYVAGRWHKGTESPQALTDASTEEVLATVGSGGIDFGEVLAHAHRQGGPALRAMSFAERGEMLQAASKAIHAHREELLDTSAANAGTTRGDGKFDVDGATATLSAYGYLGKKLGDRTFLTDGDGIQLGRTARWWGQHVYVPRLGAAIHINAFNFPAWGFAEKAACAWLAGMPVITKPATSTALLTARCIEILVEADILPDGALQFIAGATGDLLDRLDPQDVVAFTGSADTARALRTRPALQRVNARFNVEADSLNAAILAPGVEDATFTLFIREVAREITQKAGQKCTAVRRVIVPAADADRVQDALSDRLGRTVVGDPADASVRMGPLATAAQLESVLDGIAALSAEARLVAGTGRRADGAGVDAGRGYFVEPTLLRTDEPDAADLVHRHEVFGPVATMMPYDGTPARAAALAARGGGMLVNSVYVDDPAWSTAFLAAGGAHAGRLYIGSSESAPESMGSGIAWPHSQHGGPGHAGDGAELGGFIGLRLYMQRVALQGARGVLAGISG